MKTLILQTYYKHDSQKIDEKEQDYKCKCCSKPIEFLGRGGSNACVDHRENPFKIRGILCSECNLGIGKLGDTPEGIKKALEYLEDNHNEDTDTTNLL